MIVLFKKFRKDLNFLKQSKEEIYDYVRNLKFCEQTDDYRLESAYKKGGKQNLDKDIVKLYRNTGKEMIS